MSSKERDPAGAKMSRRKFAQAAVMATAGAVMLPIAGSAQTETAKPGATLDTKPPQPPPLTPEEQAEAEARTAEILRKYGSRLTDAQKEEVRRIVREGQHSLTELRAFPLTNADAPATVLKIRPRSER